jgi:hypothetical protein
MSKPLKIAVYALVILFLIIDPLFLITYHSTEGFGFILIVMFSIFFGVAIGNIVFLLLKNKIESPAYAAVPIGILCLIIYGNFFDAQLDKVMYKHFAKYGQFTVGTIANGKHEYTDQRRYGNAYLAVKFTTIDSNLIYVTTGINAQQFNNYYKGEEIPVIYCTDQPKSAKVFNTQEDLNRFLKKIEMYKKSDKK